MGGVARLADRLGVRLPVVATYPQELPALRGHGSHGPQLRLHVHGCHHRLLR